MAIIFQRVGEADCIQLAGDLTMGQLSAVLRGATDGMPLFHCFVGGCGDKS